MYPTLNILTLDFVFKSLYSLMYFNFTQHMNYILKYTSLLCHIAIGLTLLSIPNVGIADFNRRDFQSDLQTFIKDFTSTSSGTYDPGLHGYYAFFHKDLPLSTSSFQKLNNNYGMTTQYFFWETDFLDSPRVSSNTKLITIFEFFLRKIIDETESVYLLNYLHGRELISPEDMKFIEVFLYAMMNSETKLFLEKNVPFQNLNLLTRLLSIDIAFEQFFEKKFPHMEWEYHKNTEPNTSLKNLLFKILAVKNWFVGSLRLKGNPLQLSIGFPSNPQIAVHTIGTHQKPNFSQPTQLLNTFISVYNPPEQIKSNLHELWNCSNKL